GRRRCAPAYTRGGAERTAANRALARQGEPARARVANYMLGRIETFPGPRPSTAPGRRCARAVRPRSAPGPGSYGDATQLLKLLPGVVRAAYQRARLDVRDADGFAHPLQILEFLGRVILLHRQVLDGRPQVLADGHDVHACGVDVAHDLLDLLQRLPESDHD